VLSRGVHAACSASASAAAASCAASPGGAIWRAAQGTVLRPSPPLAAASAMPHAGPKAPPPLSGALNESAKTRRKIVRETRFVLRVHSKTHPASDNT